MQYGIVQLHVLLKVRTTYTLHGATETYKNYTNRNITSFSHKRSTN